MGRGVVDLPGDRREPLGGRPVVDREAEEGRRLSDEEPAAAVAQALGVEEQRHLGALDRRRRGGQGELTGGDEVLDEPLPPELRVLRRAGEPGGLPGLVQRVEVPAEERLDARPARVVRPEGVPGEPVAARAPLARGDEEREQRLALVDRLAEPEGHVAGRPVAPAEAEDDVLTWLARGRREKGVEHRLGDPEPTPHHEPLDHVPRAEAVVEPPERPPADLGDDDPVPLFRQDEARQLAADADDAVEVGQAPDADRPVVGRRDEEPAVVREGEAPDRPGVSRKLPDPLPRQPVVEPECRPDPGLVERDRHDRLGRSARASGRERIRGSRVTSRSSAAVRSDGLSARRGGIPRPTGRWPIRRGQARGSTGAAGGPLPRGLGDQAASASRPRAGADNTQPSPGRPRANRRFETSEDRVVRGSSGGAGRPGARPRRSRRSVGGAPS